MSDKFPKHLDEWLNSDSSQGSTLMRPSSELAPARGSARTRYLIDPDLGDGVHWSVVDDKNIVLEAVKQWLEENVDRPRGEITIRTKAYTDAEMDALPDI